MPPRWGARAWLGRPGLEEGADADLVVYAADPRARSAPWPRPSTSCCAAAPVA